jgi:hypothetical protein
LVWLYWNFAISITRMGVRQAWEAFRKFEAVERRAEPVATFLMEWQLAGDRLTAAAPDCRYPDLLLAFKLLLAYRPDQSGN